jgi:hypothetical protein
MLMAAVTSTSLNSEPANIRSVPLGPTESSGKSFVDSLAENASLPEERRFDVGGTVQSRSVTENNGSNPGKTASELISASQAKSSSSISVAEKLKNDTTKASLTKPAEVGNATGLLANKVSLSANVPASQDGTNPGEMNAASDSTLPDEQTMLSAPGVERSSRQALVQDTPDEIESADPQITTPVAAVGADGNAKPMVIANNDLVISGEGHNEKIAETAAKGRETSAKTQKSAKAEAKQDKKDGSGVAASATGIDVQTTVLAQILVNPAGPQQSSARAKEGDILLSASSQNAGTAGAVNDKSKGSETNGVKPDENSVKDTGSSSAENSQKTQADANKPESTSAANQDSEKSKPQDVVPAATDSGQIHAAPGASGTVPSVASGGGLTQTPGAGIHLSAATSHTNASGQIATNFTDTAPVEAAHKTLMATPTSLEVGVANGTHGWLKIRAEIADGGAVNTSLSTSSPSGQEMLHRELPSLAAYLKSEHVAVNTVVIQPMVATGSDPRGSFAEASGSQQGQAQQSGGQGREGQQSQANSAPAATGANALYSSSGVGGDDESFSATSYAQGGGWLSVRA